MKTALIALAAGLIVVALMGWRGAEQHTACIQAWDKEWESRRHTYDANTIERLKSIGPGICTEIKDRTQ